MEKWECSSCGYVYSVDVVNPEFGLEPPYGFEKLPEDWVCPVCGSTKEEFEKTI